MLAIRQEARSSCVMSSASILRRRLTNVFMASLALASFDVILVVIVWGCLHDGAHPLQRELYVWLARLVNGAPAPARTPAIAEYRAPGRCRPRSEEHTSELQSLRHLVCR